MERKRWTVEHDGASHEVVLLWSYWGGAREVQVDGETVASSRMPMRWRSTQAFDLGGRRAEVRTRPAGRLSPWFTITLDVDGRRVEPEPGSSRWEASAS